MDNDTTGRAELRLACKCQRRPQRGIGPGRVAQLVRLHLDGEVVADLRDQGRK
ncbi:MAG: hypothetical protein R3F37_14580 [Candidatus Competibacteraceae bacterium]